MIHCTLLFPESVPLFERHVASRTAGDMTSGAHKSKVFLREMGRAAKLHWGQCLFGLVLMTCFNFYSHGSQDLYPTYLEKGKGLIAHQATLGSIAGNRGAIFGGNPLGLLLAVFRTQGHHHRVLHLDLRPLSSRCDLVRPMASCSSRARSSCRLECRALGV